MTNEEKQQLVEEQATSGISIKAWCRAKGIPYTTFLGWRKKADEQTARASDLEEIVWASIVAESEEATKCEAGGAIRVERNGWTITAEPGFDADALADVLKAVSKACC
ncbi:MAG: transposase [Oscillospiraceae bacterium]|nr:transposase [Oscillospiraceae bacterium]